MDAIEFLADRAQLTLLELAHREAAPAVGRADDGRIHELQHGALPESVRDDLRAPALLEKEPLEQIVVRITRRWRSGKRRRALQASKSSRKHCPTAGSSRS